MFVIQVDHDVIKLCGYMTTTGGGWEMLGTDLLVHVVLPFLDLADIRGLSRSGIVLLGPYERVVYRRTVHRDCDNALEHIDRTFHHSDGYLFRNILTMIVMMIDRLVDHKPYEEETCIDCMLRFMEDLYDTERMEALLRTARQAPLCRRTSVLFLHFKKPLSRILYP